MTHAVPHDPQVPLPLRLGQLPALASLSAPDLARVAAACTVGGVPAGATLVHEGAPDRGVYFVLAGTARLERQGEEHGTVGTGDHFGELGLLTLRNRSSTVVAV